MVEHTLKTLASIVLERDEGFHERAYLDTKGYWTIGRGHFIGKTIQELKLPRHILEALFEHDFQKHLEFTHKVFGKEFFESLDLVRQMGLYSLCFNMGSRIYTFTTTIQLLKDRKWREAATNLRVSKWARDVDPRQEKDTGRDDRVIAMIEYSELHKDYMYE